MYILWIMSAYLLIFIIRTIKVATAWDKLLGLCLISTKLTVIIIVYAHIKDTAYMLDFAIIYILFGFISVIFIAFFILNRTRGGK